MMGIVSNRLSMFLGLALVVAGALVSCGGQEPAQTIVPSATYKFLRKWGSDFTSDGRLKTPTGVAVDAAGNVFVADTGNSRIQKFSPEGVFLAKWGREGQGDGQFYFVPSSLAVVAVDAAGHVYVADTWNHRIQKFSSKGAFLAKWGRRGLFDGRFSEPVGVAVDAAGNVYVADMGNDHIQKFSSKGAFLAKWGSPGRGDGQFNGPAGIAVDAAGNVYVADTGNHRIQVFSPGP